MSLRVFQHANYPFLGWAKRAYVISGILFAIGVVAMIVNVFTIGSWLAYGVDFTGGTRMVVRVPQGVTVAEIRDALGGDEDLPISRFGAENEFTIRVPGKAADVVEKLAAKSILGGVPVSRLEPDKPDLADLVLVASTEINTDDDRAALAAALKEVL